jgi:hypothetical protein
MNRDRRPAKTKTKTKTKRARNTPKPALSDEPSKRDRHFASCFMDLEDEVHDLDRMGEIAVGLVMDWVEQSGSAPIRQAELSVCAVQQLHKLLNEFKTKYCRAWETDKAVQS